MCVCVCVSWPECIRKVSAHIFCLALCVCLCIRTKMGCWIVLKSVFNNMSTSAEELELRTMQPNTSTVCNHMHHDASDNAENTKKKKNRTLIVKHFDRYRFPEYLCRTECEPVTVCFVFSHIGSCGQSKQPGV